MKSIDGKTYMYKPFGNSKFHLYDMNCQSFINCLRASVGTASVERSFSQMKQINTKTAVERSFSQMKQINTKTAVERSFSQMKQINTKTAVERSFSQMKQINTKTAEQNF